MGETLIKALLIEDNPAEAGLIRELLLEGGGVFLDLKWVERLSASLECLDGEAFDVV